jgi:chitin synthase
MHSKSVRQAWREKVALCFLALLLGGVIGFLTVGLDRTLCPNSSADNTAHYVRIGTTPGTVGISGWSFNITQSNPTNGVNFYSIASKLPGVDVTNYFARSQSDFPSCKGLSFKAATDNPCPNSNTSCPLDKISQSTFNTLRITNTTLLVGFDWNQVANASNQFVIDGLVLDMTPYMTQHTAAVANDPVDLAIRSLLKGSQTKSGKDASRLFYNNKELSSSVDCLIERYSVGSIDKLTPGCFISNLILYAGLIVILGLVMARWIMAVLFYWFLSDRLTQPPKNLSRTVVSPSVMPEGANLNVNNVNGTAPWANKAVSAQRDGKGKLAKMNASPSSTTLVSNSSSHTVRQSTPQQTISMAQIGAELFAVCLVTCYSEGEDSLRTTLDSISNTSYSDSRKLLFIVADGMVTGAGEKMSTPDICVGLLEADPRFGTPQPMSYIAVGAGAKKENRAMVYAGHYCT